MDIYIRGALYVIATQIAYGILKYIVEVFIGFDLNAGVGMVCFIVPAMLLGGHYFNTRGESAASVKKFKITAFLMLVQFVCAALTYLVAVQFIPQIATIFILLDLGIILGLFGFIFVLGFGASYWAFGFGNKQGRKKPKGLT